VRLLLNKKWCLHATFAFQKAQIVLLIPASLKHHLLLKQLVLADILRQFYFAQLESMGVSSLYFMGRFMSSFKAVHAAASQQD